MHMYTYFKHLYLTKKRRKLRRGTMNCYDLAVEREANRVAKRCLTFWRMVISEADQGVQDFRHGSKKVTGLHPNLTLQQDCPSRPFPTSTCGWGLTSSSLFSPLPLSSPQSQGKLSFLSSEAPGKACDGFPSRDHGQRALPRVRSKPHDHFSLALSLHRQIRP